MAHSTRVARRLHEAGIFARRVTVKLKYHDFTLKTRQLRLPDPIDDATSLFEAARSLLDRFPIAGRRVRLTGVSAGELTAAPPPSLFPDPKRDRRRAVESAVASIRERFGGVGLTRAELLDAPGRPEDDDSILPRRLQPPSGDGE